MRLRWLTPIVLIFALTACPSSTTPASDGSTTFRSRQEEGAQASRFGALQGVDYTYSLYTHCGIKRIAFDGEIWEPADGPTSTSLGWSDPYEQGYLRKVAPDSLEFTSRDGSRKLTFTPLTSSPTPIPVCT